MVRIRELKWSEEKNELLKRERGLSFEAVLSAYEHDAVLDDLEHPDPSRPHQRMMIVEIEGYVCIVPYVSEGPVAFLKTIYKSRVMQRKNRGHP